MRPLADVVASPSGFDSLSNYVGQTEFPGWDCFLTQNRESSVLETCNFAEGLKALGGESDDVHVHRFGHWACGWWEALAVKQGTAAHTLAVEMEARLADYLVLDEEAFSQAEQEEADLIWRDCYDVPQRIAYIRQFRQQFEFHDWADLRACIRGDYFAGYASELIS